MRCWILLLGMSLFLAVPSVSGGAAVRDVEGLNVTVELLPDSGTFAQAYEEAIPNGFDVSFVGTNGLIDAVNRKIKWGPFFDSSARSLRYQLSPTGEFSGPIALRGEASFDGVQVETDGDSFLVPVQSIASSATRTIEEGGGTISVRVIVSASGETLAYALEEEAPRDFAVSMVNESGDLEPVSGKIKWGPFFDAKQRVLTYQLTAPAGFGGVVELEGTASFDGIEVKVVGDMSVSVALQGLKLNLGLSLSLNMN